MSFIRALNAPSSRTIRFFPTAVLAPAALNISFNVVPAFLSNICACSSGVINPLNADSKSLTTVRSLSFEDRANCVPADTLVVPGRSAGIGYPSFLERASLSSTSLGFDPLGSRGISNCIANLSISFCL